MFFPFNIFIALTDVHILTEYKGNLTDLKNLRQYRNQHLNNQKHDILLLLVKNINGSVGAIYSNASCTYDAIGWSKFRERNTATFSVDVSIFLNIAKNIIMFENCSVTPVNDLKIWEVCRNNLRFAIDMKNNPRTKCFQNYPEKLFESPTCGNEFIEEDEECDCGLNKDCLVQCDSVTCKLDITHRGKCNGNGYYDSYGQCHCKIDYFPPNCDKTQISYPQNCDEMEIRNDSGKCHCIDGFIFSKLNKQTNRQISFYVNIVLVSVIIGLLIMLLFFLCCRK